MAKILLDYFFKITAINPTPAASTAFLRQVCVVVSPKGGYLGDDGVPVLCTTNAQIAAITDNTEAQQLLAAGMSRVYIMPVEDLYLADFLEESGQDFFTLLISSDFDKDDINDTAAAGTITISSYANLLTTTPDTITVNGVVFTAQSGAATLGTGTFRAATSNDATAASLAAQINAHADLEDVVLATVVNAIVTVTALDSGSGGNAITLAYADLGGGNIGASVSGATLTGGDGLFLGTFNGVTGVVSSDTSFLATQAAIANRCAFYEAGTTNGKNMMYAFGALLSNTLDWKNQQFITMPYADDADVLGDAEALFDDKISFVISDDEFGNRLALFCAGGKAITAPYIIRNLEIDLQSKGLQYVSANQPAYTLTQAALLEDELQKVIDGDGLENGNPGYVGKGWITEGTVRVTLEEDNFVAAGRIAVPTPRALWRIAGQLTQS